MSSWAAALLPSGARPGPLSGTQRALWLDEQTNPGTVANVIVQAVRVRFALDPALFRQAVQATVDRHPTSHECAGLPVRVVHEHHDAALQIEDAAGWDDEDVGTPLVR